MMLVCGHHRLMTPTAESIQVGEPFSSSQFGDAKCYCSCRIWSINNT
jgi:hypothetical protein